MPILQPSPFLERLLRFLIPYFSGFGADLAAARADALETLASYGARTRAELLCAVQIIVFSFAALATLAEANTPDMSHSMRIRFRGCANNLSRSSQKTEQTLARRLACDVPQPTNTQASPIDDIPEDVAEEIMQQTQAAVQNYCDRATANRSTKATQPKSQSQTDENKRLWGAAMMDTLAQMGMPVKPIAGPGPTSSG